MPKVQFEVRGRIALVTGGGSGIGRAIALGLAEIGIDVGIIDREPDRMTDTAAAIERCGSRAFGCTGDVSRAADIERFVSGAAQKLGPADILVNSAGIFPRASVAEMSEAEWDRTLDTNAKGLFLACRAVVPSMMARKSGRILSITSNLGTAGVPRGSHYAASKAAINAFTRSLAKEVANDGINVNTIAPGLTDTPMMRGANTAEYIASVANTMPGRRLGQPDDVVALALFLVSEGAQHITGQVIGLRD
jgi:NAD(P)-dependent dehydrogenase (short-subunit alcohol dehydrogenase family)